ncbi:DUF4350 domain-containing protein [Micromonospora sp. NPDC049559]|uniref:DUF4350 domain-containing protein n=1 Tax=Micromonospora sp. NPDC049559 TaxID=3155923 RepID=UPI0034449DD3
MTAATVPAPNAPAADGAGGAVPPAPQVRGGRRRRRWHRLAVPFLGLALLYLVTGVAHVLEEPNLRAAGTLSPTGSGADGSSRLAETLTAAGVTVHRVGSSAEARRVLGGLGPGRATVFVPAPDFVDPRFLGTLEDAPNGHRVVLARPGRITSASLGLDTGPTRWATRTVAPGCGTDFAVAAGPAAVLRSRYGADPEYLEFRCYDGGLTGIRLGGSELLAVGATDPFRNGRIGEAGNRALATALLGRDRDLVWLDLHRPEPRPRAPLPRPRYDQPERGGGTGGNPMWTAFPAGLWASLGLLGLLGLLIAVVRARRLGPPVAEPLPVVVPATETVTGRGRLYHRIHAREATLEALRSAALRRIAPLVAPARGLLAPHRAVASGWDDELIGYVADRTGRPVDQVRAILRGPAPATDEELRYAVADLDDLVAAVLAVGARRTGDGSGDPDGSVESGGEL